MTVRVAQALLRRRRNRADEFFIRLAQRSSPGLMRPGGPAFMADEIIDSEPEFDVGELRSYRSGERPDATERRSAPAK